MHALFIFYSLSETGIMPSRHKPATCFQCNKTYSRRYYYIKHLPKCNRRFLEQGPSSAFMTMTMTSDNGGGQFTCQVCKASFTKNSNLLRHRYTQHTPSPVKRRASPTKTTTTTSPAKPSSPTKHRRLPHQRCEHCGMQFIRMDNLLRHLNNGKCPVLKPPSPLPLDQSSTLRRKLFDKA